MMTLKWNDNTKKAVAIGLGLSAITLIFLARRQFSRVLGQAFDSFGRSTPWSQLSLGNSSVTIGRSGCFLLSLTNAVNAIRGTRLTPDVANRTIKQAGGFAGPNLIIPVGASALGLSVGTDTRGLSSMRTAVDNALARGGKVLLRVNHSPGGGADHAVLIHKKTSSGYVAADSALARNVDFDDDFTSDAGREWGSRAPYLGVSVVTLFG